VYIDLGGHNYGPITLTITTSGYHKDPGWDIKVIFHQLSLTDEINSITIPTTIPW